MTSIARLICLIALLFALLAALPARAEAPKVVADIAPVHGIVAEVMGDLGKPGLILPPGADPHHHQMRPSEARMLAEADLVVWMGPELTPWLPRVLRNVSGAESLVLLHLEGGGATAKDDAGNGEADPHAWLDPMNGARYARVIAARLAALDPDNAAAYRQNAERLAAELQAMTEEIRAALAPLQGWLLLPYHDAFGHFLDRFGLPHHGGLTDAHGAAPGARRLAELRAAARAAPHACLLLQPGADPGLLEAVLPGAGADAPVIDPVLTDAPLGRGYYQALIRGIAQAFASCLRD